MAIVRQELAEYGKKVDERGLTAGAGGNLSAREGRFVWVKPTGFSMADIKGPDMCCIDLSCLMNTHSQERLNCSLCLERRIPLSMSLI